jgi:RNA polymerase sigma factor (sigma-70 family)
VLDPNAVEISPAVPESSAVAAVLDVPGARSESQDVGATYEQYRDLLLHVACRKFRVPETDAENLMQEVFLSFMQNEARVENTKAWLVAAMCNASRHYWRLSARTEAMPEDIGDHSDPVSHGLADRMALMLTLRKALRYLQPRCRETLYMHYFEGRSAVDIARDLDTTTRYSEKLIHNCLKRVREIYFSITAVRR